MSCSFNPQGLHFVRQGEQSETNKLLNFVKRKSVVGRQEDCDVQLSSKNVSRRHFIIEFNDGKMYIEDLESSNGTFLNDNKLVQKTEVEENDIIGIGARKAKPGEEAETLIYKAKVQEVIAISDSSDSDELDEICNEIQNLTSPSLVIAPIVVEIIELSDEETETDLRWKQKINPTTNSPPSSSQIEADNEPIAGPSGFQRNEPPPATITPVQITFPVTRELTVNLKKLSPEELDLLIAGKLDSSSANESDCVTPGNSKKSHHYKRSKPKNVTTKKTNAKRKKNNICSSSDESSDEDKSCGSSGSDSSVNNKSLRSRQESRYKRDEFKKYERTHQKLQTLVDAESGDESDVKKKPSKSVKPVVKPLINEKDLECVPSSSSQPGSKLIIRRKSICEPLPEKTLQAVEQHKKNTSTKVPFPDFKIPKKRAPSPSPEQPPKRPKTNKPQKPALPNKAVKPNGIANNLRRPIEIIEAPSMPPRRGFLPNATSTPNVKNLPEAKVPPKRRPSVCNDKEPPKRLSTSTCDNERDMFEKARELREAISKEPPKKPAPKRRNSIHDSMISSVIQPLPMRETNNNNYKDQPSTSTGMIREVDIFAAQPVKPKAPPKRRNSVHESQFSRDDPLSKEIAEKMKEEQRDRLRRIALKENQEKDANNKLPSERILARPKVKCTVYNRGDFLANPPPESIAKPARRMSVTNVTSAPVKEVTSADTNEVLSEILQFRAKHVIPAQSLEIGDGQCNNLRFYNDIDAIDEVAIQPDCIAPGFYNPISFTQEESNLANLNLPYLEAPVAQPILLRSILKKDSATPNPNKIKKRIRFNDEPQIRFFTSSPDEYHTAEEPPEVIPQPEVAVIPQQQSSSLRTNSRLNCATAEDKAVAIIINMKAEWLTTLPPPNEEQFLSKPMKPSYSSLEEMQEVFQPIMSLELLKKVSSLYSKSLETIYKDNSWNHLMLKSSKYDSRGRRQIELLLNDNAKGFTTGCLLLVKAKEVSSGREFEFLGYIESAQKGNVLNGETITVAAIFDSVRLESVTTVKTRKIGYIRYELKPLIALNNLDETSPLVEKMLQPGKCDPCDMLPSNTAAINEWGLNEKQFQAVRQLTHDTLTGGIIAVEGVQAADKVKVINASVKNIFNEYRNQSLKILICAKDNRSVDSLTTGLQSKTEVNIDLLRFGSYTAQERIDEKVLPLTLSQKADEAFKQFKRLNIHKKFKNIQEDIVNKATVVLSTINASFELLEYRKQFDICFIADASLCSEAETLIIMQLQITKLILVGDKPVASSSQNSLFARFCETFKLKDDKPVITMQ